MCKERFDVVGLDNQRTAYEVEQYLSGIPSVEGADADFLSNILVVEYDESQIDKERILDEIEHSGCKPEDRISGLVDRLKTRMTM